MNEALYLTSAILILLFSVILHEVMHGYVALRFGDRTAKNAGRLTLNPIPHIDPIGTLLIPGLLLLPTILFGTPPGFIVGWAKPVPVNPLNFSNIRTGELLVSLAGIGSNFLLAVLSAFFYHLLLPMSNTEIFTDLLRFSFTINIVLAIFNLIPIPPLDGSKVLMSQLPYHLARQYDRLTPYGYMILLALYMIPIAGIPAISLILGISVRILSLIFQVPPRLF